VLAPKRMGVSGRYVDLAAFSQDDVDIRDINRSLNYIYRFTGHWRDREPLTVAQHTILTMCIADDMFPGEVDVKFDCLLHDMPEAYYGDIATPLKKVLKTSYREVTNYIDDIVYKKLWKIEPKFTPEVESKRKTCDLMALDIERRCMWDSTRGKALWPDVPDPKLYSQRERLELFDLVQRSRYHDLDEEYKVFR
jgi:hypothetical protein